ncbi:hypothetical protein QR685DRAFT_571524 [Neurospora intermedia]|uniref:Uncharacterized protein n=1 Tax=Neurospora intermedia TaxID=5142 RepID=A0ABR3DES9_NEUIN
MTSLLRGPSAMAQGGRLNQPSFKAGTSPELAVTNKPAQDSYLQDRSNKRVEFDNFESNTSERTEWEEKYFQPRRSDTIFSSFSNASTVTNTTEPDPLTPATASFEVVNIFQYPSSLSLMESRCGSPAPMTFHAGTHFRSEEGLDIHPVDMTTANFTDEGLSSPRHIISPNLKPRRTFREQETLRKNLQDPARHLTKWRRKDSMSKHAVFQVGPPSDATHPEKPLVSQITAGLRAKSAGDPNIVMPVRPKEESESLVPAAKTSRNLNLPDLQGMQIDETSGDVRADATQESVPQDVDTPTSGKGSSPEGLSPLIMTPGLDDLEDIETSPIHILDAGLIQDVCEQILRQAFDTEYDDIAHTDAAGEAYNTVSYCLDELSRILPDESLFSSAICIQELPRGAGHIAPAQQEGSGSSSGTGRRGGVNNGSQKRPNDDGNGYPSRGPEDGSGPGDRGLDGGGNDGGNKRARITTELGDQGLSCPFRKRNPERFNIRDHQQCAVRPFDNIYELKCKEDMRSREAVQAHLAVPRDSICSPQEGIASRNPEDGITDRHEFLLNNRKADGKIDNWQDLWHNLFGLDEEVPDPDFEPPVEREEFYRDLQNARPQLKEALTSNEELRRFGNQRSEGHHVEQLVDIFYSHIGQVFDNSRRQPMNTSRRQRVGKRIPRVEPSNSASPISPMTQKPARRLGQLAVPRQIVRKRLINGDSNGGSLASSLETINSAESWANVGQAEMVTRAAPGMDSSGSVQSRQAQVAQTGVGVGVSPSSFRQAQQHDLFVTPSPVTPPTPINPQVGFGAYGNEVVNLSQPAQATRFHHGRQDLVDLGIEMVNHCRPTQDMNGLSDNHRAEARGMIGPSPQPQQHKPAEMNFGGPLPQHLAYQQQPGHMELASPDDAQMIMGGIELFEAQESTNVFFVLYSRHLVLELVRYLLCLEVIVVNEGLGCEDDVRVFANGYDGVNGELDLAGDEGILGGCEGRGGDGNGS